MPVEMIRQILMMTPSIIMDRTRTIISFLTGSLYLQQRCGKKFLVLSLLPHKRGELFYLVLQTGKKVLTTTVYHCNQTPAAKSINADGSSLLATDWELVELKDNKLLSLGSGDKVTVNSPPAHSKRLIFKPNTGTNF